MRISHSTKIRLEKARELYQQNGNISKTARELGIHRSTVDRWLREGLLEPVISPEESPESGLDELVNKALKVMDTALDTGAVKPAQIRAAIEIVKASNALRAQAKAQEAEQSLAELIAEESSEESD